MLSTEFSCRLNPCKLYCFCYSRLVFNEGLFVTLVDSTDLLNLRNLIQSMVDLLILALEKNSSGPPLLCRFPAVGIGVDPPSMGTHNIDGLGMEILWRIPVMARSTTGWKPLVVSPPELGFMTAVYG